MLKIKSGKKLRMSEEYAYLEFVLSSKFTFLRIFMLLYLFYSYANHIYIEICLYLIKLKLLRRYLNVWQGFYI